MNRSRRASVAFGVVLVLLGVWLFIIQWVPGLQAWFGLSATWPLIVVGIGVLFLVFALVAGIPGMAVPGSIIAGLGCLLYWQNATNNWESWAYAWTLFPGFVGIGVILMGLMGQDTRRSIAGGAWLVVISAVMFLVFASFFGGQNMLGPYWPVLLIGLGVLLLLQSLVRHVTPRRPGGKSNA